MSFPAYARSVLGVNLFVILWGALVRATGSGAGCGQHWPLCNGVVVPESPATATLIEFTHRASSGAALVLVIGLVWWSRRAFPAGSRVRAAAAWSLALVIIEALVGAGLVLFGLVGNNTSPSRAPYLAFHLLNTFLLLGALTLTELWSRRPEPLQKPRQGSSRWLLGAGMLACLAVGMSGAIAALGDTLFPAATLREGLQADASSTAHILVRLRVIHPVLALLTGLYLSVMVWAVYRQRPEATQSGWGRAVSGLVLLQLGVGMTNLLLLAPTGLQLVHLLIADLLWISVVAFAAVSLAAAPRRVVA